MEAATSPPIWFYIIVSTASILTIGTIIFGIIAWFTTARSTVKDLKGFGEWKGKVDSDRSIFRKFMQTIRKEIRKDIKNLTKRIDDVLLQLPKLVTVGQSPLRLTDLGKDISGELNAKELAKQLAPKIIEKLGTGSQAFTIQDMCFEYINEEFEPSDDVATQISKSAYEHGLKRKQVREVLAVELRDRVLKLTGAENQA